MTAEDNKLKEELAESIKDFEVKKKYGKIEIKFEAGIITMIDATKRSVRVIQKK